MPYRLLDLHLEQPPLELTLGPEEVGLGLLVRARGRPVAFDLHALPPGTRLDAQALRALAEPELSDHLCAQAIREELAPAPPAPPLSLTIAVCTRARTELLEPCLRSILALPDRPSDLDVLVVDNDPPDEATADLVAALPEVRYAREPRPGLDFARNRALAETRGEWVAYLDDDVEVDPGWLRGLGEAVAENPDAGLVTGLVLPRELSTDAQVIFERRGGFRRGLRKLRYEGEHQPGNPFFPLGAGIFGAGANMVVRRDAARALGGFDEALDTGPPLPGGGDLDIFSRTVRAGWPLVYEPTLLVFHRHRREYEALRRQYFTWGDGFMAYVAKSYRSDPTTRRKLRGLLVWWVRYELAQVVRAGLGRGWGHPDLALAELRGGLVGLAGSYARSRRRVAAINRAHA